MYKYYNANTFGNNVEDCSIRALSVAEDISWDKAYIKLSDYARKKGLMLSSYESVESYLDENYERKCFYGMTVKDFIKSHPYGTFLVTMKGHITVIKDGVNYDTFDCSDRRIWCAWLVDIR